MATKKVADPFAVPQQSDGADEFYDPDKEPQALGDIAKTALAAVPDPAQNALDGLNDEDILHVKFVGMAYKGVELTAKLGDEMQFEVGGRVVGTGEDLMADGHTRHFVKLEVGHVELIK